MIEFIWPLMFLLLPLPILVRMLSGSNSQAALSVPNMDYFHTDKTPSGKSSSGWRLILLWIAWILLITAASRPEWIGEPVNLSVTGRDMIMAVDVSGSMNTEDMELHKRQVNRLVVVKSVVSEFLEQRQGDRVGLILFGSNAYLQAPLTFDLNTVTKFLTEAPVGIAGGKTAIGDAIGLAVKRLRERPESTRLLILLTDGASNAGEIEPIKAAELASHANVKIHTIGVGSNEMQVSGFLGAFSPRKINPSADLDEETLTRIAEATGGEYFRAHNTVELREIYALIDSLEPVEQDPEVFRPTQSLFVWPLGSAWLVVIVLYLSLLLSNTRAVKT
ncbi:MAG: VWA domain-containing protein [Pseudomonadales bacterium]|nr:VWA domain-containing protein [Pseudomonadales bacterium]